MTENNSSDRNDLGSGSIGKLLFKLALPAIIAQLVNVLYNIIDRVFIGRLENGDMAMAGVGVAFPIITLISAFSALIGMGGAPIAAIKMGKQDKDGAEKILSNSFSSIIIISVILTIIFTVFKEQMLWAFGASEATINYAIDYLKIYVLGTICVQIAIGMNPFINTQGFAKIGMFTVMIGAVINIILDPIFIFVLDFGVKGAALASVIGQLASAIWALQFLFGKKSILKIRKEYLLPDIKVVSSIVALGVSPFIMQATESLVLISQNNQLSKYGGDIAVSSMAIMSSVMQIILLPLMGISQGAQPILSFNYGANNIKRVKKTFKLLLISCLTYTFIMCTLVMVWPQIFVNMFNNKPELVETTSYCMRIFFAGIFIFGAQIACQQTFLALGKAKISLLLALLRKVVLLVPLIFILPMIMDDKFRAVLLAEPFADVIATIATVICFIVFAKRLFNGLNKVEENF